MKLLVQHCLQQAMVALTINAQIFVDDDISIQLTYPKKTQHGHVSTNLAFVLMRYCHNAASQIAKQLLVYLPEHPAIERVEIAGGGFLNFFIRQSSMLAVVEEMLMQAASFRLGLGPEIPSITGAKSNLLLYAVTRTDHILEQLVQQGLFWCEKTGKIALSRIHGVRAQGLIVLLNRYHDVDKQSACRVMTDYLLQLANELHLYYNTVTLLCDDVELRQAQFGLLTAVNWVLKKGIGGHGEILC